MNPNASDQSVTEEAAARITPFVRGARYYQGLGVIEYVNQDVSFRSDLITNQYEILWHLEKTEVVGVKIFVGSPEDIRRFLAEHQMDPNAPIPLSALLAAMRATINANQSNPGSEAETRSQIYFLSIGEEVVGNATLAPERWNIEPSA